MEVAEQKQKSIEQRSLLKLAGRVIPWFITLIALYFAFRGVDWARLLGHIGDANGFWLGLVVALTVSSYLMRARRWEFLFPERVITFTASVRVLVIGFFMNNVLPARAGEIVRAHAGGKVTGTTRTLVLATIASERLADGLMLSLLFVAFALHAGGDALSQNLLTVAILFGSVTLAVIVAIILREPLFTIFQKLSERLNHRAATYTLHRFQIFIEGLTPLLNKKRLPILSLWTVAIWFVELAAFVSVSIAFDAGLSFAQCVLFLVTVNFSSLIPAAPGGVGVIEAIASAVLVSVGIPKEHALTMVLAQHVTQYLVVGIPGAIFTLTWKGHLRED